ncbi:PAS domain-containing protein, partial [Microvirga arabica]|uniref:PAS domain-containing protein n=1 Tax=Microvirga arabica TaxID=1128671 RepID=UPI001FE91D7C
MTLQTPQNIDPKDIDLTACDREPIHIPGSIQPYGILLALRLSDRTLAYASANVADIFGLDPTGILGRPFAEVLPVLAQEFEAPLADPPQAGTTRTLRTIGLATTTGERPYEAAVSRSGDHAVLELEESPSDSVS